MSLDYCAEHGVHEDPGCDGCRAFMDAPARGMALPAVSRTLAEAVLAAHDDAGVGHLGSETQRRLAAAYGHARSIVDEVARV